MPFKKGICPNPKGRPKGIIDKRLLYKSIINAHSEELINIAIEKAKGGNDTMMKLVLERVLPAKARDNLVTKDIMKGSIDEQSDNIIKAVDEGRLTPLESKDLMNTLKAKQEITEMSDLRKDVEELKNLVSGD